MSENRITRMITGRFGAIGRRLGISNISFLQKAYIAAVGLMLPNHEAQVELDGNKMIVPNPRQSILGRMIYLYGSWEPVVSQFLRSKLQSRMVVLDVGAHAGYYTLLMAQQVGQGGRVVAFEPNRAVRELLSRNIELNGYDQVTVCPFALFSHDGTTILETLDNSNMRLSPNAQAGAAEQVVMREFDGCRAELGIERVNLLKLDVEGAEFDVLQGMRDLLTSCHPDLLIEVHLEGLAQFNHTPAELLDYVKSLGYGVEPIWSQEGTDTVFCKQLPS